MIPAVVHCVVSENEQGQENYYTNTPRDLGHDYVMMCAIYLKICSMSCG